jgi:hypothetical protein
MGKFHFLFGQVIDKKEVRAHVKGIEQVGAQVNLSIKIFDLSVSRQGAVYRYGLL